MANKDTKCSDLRVLLCAPYPPPFGGIASLIVSLCPGLTALGADVVVLCFCKKNSVEKVDGATLYRYSLRSQMWRMLLPTSWLTWLRVLSTYRGADLTFRQLISLALKTILLSQIANRHRSNVVSFYESDSAMELLACKKIWGASRGIALTVFGEIHDNAAFMQSRSKLFHHIIDSADAVMSSSAHCANSFKKIGVSRTIDVNYVGVDLARFQDDGSLRKAYRAQLHVEEQTPVLFFMGRFVPEMGLENLIAMVPEIIKRYGPQFKIVLAGAKGPLSKPALKCQDEYPDQVIVMNDVKFDLLPSMYAAADIVLTPSVDQHACMGVTIKEGMAASRTVIGSNSGGIPEAIVDGETGLIVPLAANGEVDNETFLAAILSLLSSPQRLETMGRKARLRAVELFSEEATVQRSSNAFLHCLSKTR